MELQKYLYEWLQYEKTKNTIKHVKNKTFVCFKMQGGKKYKNGGGLQLCYRFRAF